MIASSLASTASPPAVATYTRYVKPRDLVTNTERGASDSSSGVPSARRGAAADDPSASTSGGTEMVDSMASARRLCDVLSKRRLWVGGQGTPVSVLWTAFLEALCVSENLFGRV